ncbi:tyrosine-type recombinase/integrase [Deferribacter thermophilus]|uniref:Arm DNA-binding domain-containing protein n=1 Tax=Deferribacter thermophilus TaxID=53573 RepID=UPI003C26EB33
MAKVSVGVDRGKIFIRFKHKGIYCKEYLGLDDTKQNRRYAENLAFDVERELLLGTFDYAKYFPNSKKLKLFGVTQRKEYTFGEYAERWLARLQKKIDAGLLDTGTFKGYMSGYKKIMESEFWDKKINDITKVDIEDYIIYLANGRNGRNGRKNKTVNNLLIPLRLILKSAFEEEIIDKDLSKYAKCLKNEKVDIDPFTVEEVKLILDYMQKKYPHLHLFFAIGFFTGMRLSEIIAMKWKKFDFNRNIYLVDTVIVKGEEKNKTKTIESHREIILPDVLLPFVKNHKQYTFLKSEYVFVNQYNKPFSRPDKISELYWKPALKKLGIRYRNMYQMRHTHAVLSIIAGDNPHDIARRMGHSNLETFFRRYAKYIKGYTAESKISNLFTNGLPENCRNSVEFKN